jgi:hypothetical protein
LNNKNFEGSIIRVQFSKNSDGHTTSNKIRSELRMSVLGLDSRTSWQDLKDWARAAGNVNFANVFNKGGEKVGVVEYEVKFERDE